MIHGKKMTYKAASYLKKPHFCPDCKTQMEVITVSKVVNSRSPEAKQHDFSIMHGTNMVGNIEFSWQELKCPACERQVTIEDMQRIEYDSLDDEQKIAHDKKEARKVFWFKMFMAAVVILWIAYLLLK